MRGVDIRRLSKFRCHEGIMMESAAGMEQKSFATAIKENKKAVRMMVLGSYQDMLDGKGRDYKEFFSELESRYKNAGV